MKITLLCEFLLVTCLPMLVISNPVPDPQNLTPDPPAQHWSYNDTTSWKEHFSSCGGAHQSPINLDLTQAFAADYPDFAFTNYETVFPEMVTNNGHTVTLQLQTDSASPNLPYITFGGLNDRYNFYMLHFHWGRDSSGGSEHLINGSPYPAELHMVHYNAKYGGFNEAVPFQDGLAVLGIMIELQTRDNTAFRHIEQFNSILNPDANKSDYLQYAVPLSDLLPDSTRSFYRYNGSLTTPGCNEDVIWTIFDTPIAVSERQLAMLRQLTNSDGQQLENNFRPVQELHDRVLLYRPDPTLYSWDESVQAAMDARLEFFRQQQLVLSSIGVI